MRFMMFMYPRSAKRSWDRAPRTSAEMGRYNEELHKAGMLLSLDGLQPPERGRARQLRRRQGDASPTGPFAEAKEVVGGYWLIQAALEGGGGRVGQPLPRRRRRRIEVRRVFEMEDFPQDVQDAAAGADLERREPCTDGHARDRGGLADRVARLIAGLARMVARRRPRRGPGAGRAGRGAGAVAASRASRTTRAPG